MIVHLFLSNLLFFTILLPFLAAMLSVWLPDTISRLTNLVITSIVCTISVILVFLSPTSVAINGEPLFGVDNLSVFSLLFVNLLAFGFCLYSYHSPLKSTRTYFPLTLLFINGTLIADHSVLFTIFWGLSGVMLYVYCIQNRKAGEIAKKTFIISGISDALLIFAFSIIGVMSHSGYSVVDLQVGTSDTWHLAAFVSLAFASFAKAGGFPLHTWIPEYSEKSVMDSVYLLPASWDKLIGIYLLGRLFLNAASPPLSSVHILFAAFGAITIMAGVMMALIQHNGRRLLGYHAVSQVGYMILGLTTGNPVGIAGGLLHMVNHSIYKSALFMSLGNVEQKTGTVELRELGNLRKKMPATFLGALISSLSISGVPPTNGFISKGLVYSGVLVAAAQTSGLYRVVFLVSFVFALAGTALTMSSFLKFMYTIFFGEQSGKWKNISENNASLILPVLSNAAFCIIIGLAWKIFPMKILEPYIPLKLLSSTGSYSLTQTFLIKYLPLVSGGFFFYLFFRLVRYKQLLDKKPSVHQSPEETQSDFFHDIHDTYPLSVLYAAVERKWFDLFEIMKKITMKLSSTLRMIHIGEMSYYTSWIIVGFVCISLILYLLRGG